MKSFGLAQKYLSEAKDIVLDKTNSPDFASIRVGIWMRFVKENPDFAQYLLRAADSLYEGDTQGRQRFLDSCMPDIAIAQTAHDMCLYATELGTYTVA